MNVQSYTKQIVIKAYECDAFGHLMLGAALRLVQQVSTDQCNEIGLDAAEYERTHTGFVLAKTAIEFYAPIQEGAKITLTTQPNNAQRAVFFRYTELRSETGELLAAADTRWVLIDTQTKRILRRPPEDMFMPFVQADVPTLPIEIEKAPLKPAGTACATYTRCDIYRHLNNTYYADILCDALPIEVWQSVCVKRLAISYQREVPLGHSFALENGLISENNYYFVGESNGAKHFEAQLTLG